ncbi:unnamed protein product [Discula destructiva]
MNSGSTSTPSSPYSLSTDRYKANVNRTKTRKWVEAKKIDYGGDDWGADDDFDEDDDDAGDVSSANGRSQTMPLPQSQPSRTDRLAGLRAIGDGSGSSTPRSGSAGSARSLRPSERIALERHGSGGLQTRNITAPPALSLNTGVQAQRPVQSAAEPPESGSSAQQQSPYPPRKSSMSQQDRPDLTIERDTQHPPRTSSRSASPHLRSPPSAVGSAAASPRIIRPSDIYKRVEEEKERKRKSLDSTQRPNLEGGGSGDDPDAGHAQRRPSFDKNEAEGNRDLQPLAPVAERKGEYGFDGLMINPGAPLPPQPSVSKDTETETARDPGTKQDSAPSLSSEPTPPTVQYPSTSNDPPPVQQPKKRYSLSPKLPDFARLSGFGSDFFSSGGGLLGGSGSPKQRDAPADATRMPATSSILEPGSTGVTHNAEPTRHAGEEITAAPIDHQPDALSNTQAPLEPSQPQPLRPSLPGTWVSETTTSAGEMATPFAEQGDKSGSKIPTIGEHPDDASLKPAPLRTPTPRDRESFSRATDDERASNKSGRSSPTKPDPLRTKASLLSNVEQSDQTPTQEQHTGASFEDQQTTDEAPVAPAPLQPRKSGVDLASQESLRPMLRTDTTMDDNSSPLKESDVLRDEIIRSLSPVPGMDSHLDAQSDIGAARQSTRLSDIYGDYWAGGDDRMEDEQGDIDHNDALASVQEDEPASAAATPPPVSELEAIKPNIRRERFSWEGSASPVPSSSKHPLPELPKDDVPFEASQLASPVDSDVMSPLISLPVVSLDRDNEGTTLKDDRAPGDEAATTANHDSELFSPSSEKMTVESPTTPPAGNIYLTSQDPEPIRSDSPTDVPLPRSPSPAKPGNGGGSAEVTTPTSSGPQNTMNLKQIMALPTSTERLYKLHEARAEFASTPSGLAQWLAQLLVQPEHAHAGPGFKYMIAGDDAALFANQQRKHSGAAGALVGGEGAMGGAGGPGRRTSISLGGGGGGGGSVRIGTGAQAQLGNLMHGPAGAKGKELLQSAGKMGKGLLSKGKSKLRERAESKKG